MTNPKKVKRVVLGEGLYGPIKIGNSIIGHTTCSPKDFTLLPPKLEVPTGKKIRLIAEVLED